MMRVNLVRFLVTLLIIMVLQYVLAYVLALLGVSGIFAILVIAFVMAIFFAFLNYPAPFRKTAVKDPYFHKMVAIFFVVFFLVNLLF